jgi:hypothetical protein
MAETIEKQIAEIIKPAYKVNGEQYADVAINASCLLLADNIITLLEANGWESPESVKARDQREIDAERIMNREAAFEERRLMAEVQYWKDKNYELGG